MHPCSQDTAYDHRTRQGADRGNLHHGLSIKEKTLFFTSVFVQPLFYLNFFSWKEKKTTFSLTAIKKGAVILPLILLGSPSCQQDSGGHWDSWLWYGLQNFCYVQGRGDWLFSLTWQPNESLECWTEFTLKVTLQCRLPYLGERTVRKNILLITSWPWQKVRTFHT